MAVLTAFALVPSAFAAHTSNFQPYSLVINNNSGGLLEVKNSKGLSGISRKMDIEEGQSATAMVKRRGSELRVVAGPENNKKGHVVRVYNKMQGAHRPSVTFTETGVVTNGFFTQEKNFRVTLVNHSGGIARIVDASDTTGKGLQISPRQSTVITVKPNSFITIEAGPEKSKMVYKVQFADQTGKNPTIQLTKRSFSSNGIRATDVVVQSQRQSTIVRPKLEAKVARKNLAMVKEHHTKKSGMKADRSNKTENLKRKTTEQLARKHYRSSMNRTNE